MQREPRKMEPRSMRTATMMAASRVGSMMKLATEMRDDPRREYRLRAHECIACFYPSQMGGAAMTTQPCMSCLEPQMYGSTNTDALCMPCAEAGKLCKHCGGDLNMDTDRKDWPEPKENNGGK